MKKQLQVMKFGGTSVGDASCIARVCEIVKEASRDHSILVVVSAMSGVTNRLIEAATRAEAGERDNAALLIDALRKQHDVALNALIHDPETRKRLSARIEELLKEATRLCDGTALIRELTPRTLDSVSSLGERLSAPLVAAALKECGVETEAVEATELIVTDGYHGAAEPAIERTRERCEVRLRPLLQKEIVPVVTGFIGATPEGVLTTLGRGGSDYSATILGAAISADEIIIWTDVNGVLSADPRLVPEARTIPEISYREAAELAYFGAKVLHPKTLRAVIAAEIPVWIRNTFEASR
jgi:aspartate kinase